MTRLSSALLAIPLAVLTGCALTSTAPPSTQAGHLALQGIVHGGIQPVVGAKVYLLATNTTSYAGASVPLLTAGDGQNSDSGMLSSAFYVKTGSYGQFTITGDYSCTAGQEVYLLAVGGNTGAGENSSSVLMSLLGDCPGGASAFLSTLPNIFVSEVTTAAAAYSVAGFATDAYHIGAPSTHPEAAAGIRNAFASFFNLVDISSGVANATMPNDTTHSTAPQSTLNTIGNILASCVNSNNGSQANCSTLFANVGGTGVTDTASAAIHLAQHPNATNAGTLIGLQAGIGAPYTPHLSGTPTDFILKFTYTGGGINGPVTLDIDAVGNVWVVNRTGNSLTEIAPYSTTRYPVAGVNPGSKLVYPSSIGIDPTGAYVWIGTCDTNDYYNGYCTQGSIYKVAVASPTAVAASTATNMTTVEVLTVTGTGSLWTVDAQDATLINFNATPAFVQYYYNSTSGPSGTTSASNGIAINASNVPSVLDADIGQICTNPASNFELTCYQNGLKTPTNAAFDSSGNIWIADTTKGFVKYTSGYALSTTVSTVMPNPYSIPGSNYTGMSGLDVTQPNMPAAMAVDGAANLWAFNNNNSSIAEISGTTVVSGSGFLTGTTIADHLQIDSSGNVWITDHKNNVVTEIIGAATPTVTPLSANLAMPYSAPASKP